VADGLRGPTALTERHFFSPEFSDWCITVWTISLTTGRHHTVPPPPHSHYHLALRCCDAAGCLFPGPLQFNTCGLADIPLPPTYDVDFTWPADLPSTPDGDTGLPTRCLDVAFSAFAGFRRLDELAVWDVPTLAPHRLPRSRQRLNAYLHRDAVSTGTYHTYPLFRLTAWWTGPPTFHPTCQSSEVDAT